MTVKEYFKSPVLMGLIASLAIVPFVSILMTRAIGDEGYATGSTGTSGCGNCHSVCTTDGAYWQYYAIDKNTDTITPNNPDTHIRGSSETDKYMHVDNSRVYGNVTFYGGDISNACYQVGGYWRRSVVDHEPGCMAGSHSLSVGYGSSSGFHHVQVGLSTSYTTKGALDSSGYVSAFNNGGIDFADPEVPIPSDPANGKTILKLYDEWVAYATENELRTIGDIHGVSWFCWAPEMNKPKWQSKTNVYSPGYQTVSSDFIDYQTDTPLEITANPGDTITVNLNSYLKSGRDKEEKTRFFVRHKATSTGDLWSTTINGGSLTAFSVIYMPEQEFTTRDANQHSVLTENGMPTEYIVRIPNSVTSGTVKICEEIFYLKEGLEETRPITQFGTHACAVIKVEEPQDIPVTTTDCLRLDATVSPYKSDTNGMSKVINYSASTYRSWRDYVIGKPGDTIQFCHSLAFGNRYVGHASASSMLPGASSVTMSQSWEIIAKRDGSRNDAYRFPAATATRQTRFLGTTISGDDPYPLGEFTVTPHSNGIGTAQYSWVLYSPYDNNSYDCNYRQYTVIPYTPNGFKAPGFVGSSCGATRTGHTSQAGHYIQQQLKYDILKGWVTKSHNDTGTCACNVNTRVITNFDHPSYESAKRGTYWGLSSIEGNTVCQTSGCCCSSYTCGRYHNLCCCNYVQYYSPSKTVTYPTMWRNYGIAQPEATAWFPFNFKTEVHSQISSGVKFLGESVTISGSWSVLKRTNTTASPDYPTYATIMPDDSKYRVYEILLPENYSGSITGANNQSVDVCQYYGVSSQYCKIVDTIDSSHAYKSQNRFPFNPIGSYAGHTDSTPNYSRTIPDTDQYVGWKYCVGTSMWPAGSHREETNTESNNMGNTWAMKSGNEWYNISNLSCVTIAKKPNFQVWGAGIFTNGSIKTSISDKYVNGQFNTAYTTSGTNRIYGSWDEYSIIAGRRVQGMASGAALGYNPGYAFNLPFGGVDPSTSHQAASPETFANTTSPVGYSGVQGLNSSTLTRLKARYRDAARAHDPYSDQYVVQDDDTGTQYFYYDDSASISDIQAVLHSSSTYSYENEQIADTRAKHISSTLATSGGALRKGTNNTDFGADNTLVIYVQGTLRIDKNICYSNNAGECTNGQPAKLSSYSLTTDSIASLPQILIFARDVTISENVDRVEAWIILDEYGSGELRTCDVYQPSFHSCDQTLVITGPVFAKKLTLFRTAGANFSIRGSGDVLERDLEDDGSIAPGEIFNLRADAYLWAYNQAQRSTEAVTTYSRELAPRF